jgi:hypothetical protein
MKHKLHKLGACVAMALAALWGNPAGAADHAESPVVESDAASDIADVYAFLDPNDNNKVVLASDVHGFIVPGENGNLGGFAHDVLYRFNIENTGDAKIDKTIEVTFSAVASRSQPQTATVTIPARRKKDTKSFTAPTTVASATEATAPTPTVTTDGATGISFFAGLTDDPFFFDIPAFNRAAAEILKGDGAAAGAALMRGRNTFAGYNVQMIALSVPKDLLLGSAGSKIGVSATTLRKRITKYSKKKDPVSSGPYQPIDRMGVPAVNTVLIPFPRKDEYNRATTEDDAAGKFATDIVATLKALGTDQAHIDILASVAVATGDQLRLDTAVANTGAQGGNNKEAAFPNGRRPADDVIDTLIFLVSNEGLTTGDNVNSNDVPFRDTFPFFAPSHQPLDTGVIDDNTRN